MIANLHLSSCLAKSHSLEVMIDQHGVVIIQSGDRIEQGREQIGPRVFYGCRVLVDPVKDLFQMREADLGKAALHICRRVFCILPKANRAASVHLNLQHQLNQFVHLLLAVTVTEIVVLDLFSDLIQLC